MNCRKHVLNDYAVPEDCVGIHWFGQNSFVFKDSSGTTIAVDPFFPHDRPANKYLFPEPPLREDTLHVDWILLTHDHYDHTCIESLKKFEQGSPEVRFAGPVECVEHLLAEGIAQEKTKTLCAGDEITCGGIVVWAVRSKLREGNPSKGIAPPKKSHLGYVIQTNGGRIYISGDGQNDLGANETLIEPIAALKPDLGCITTHPTEGEFPYFDGAVQLVRAVGCTTVIPAHYSCFVQRTYDPTELARLIPEDGPRTLVIPYDGFALYSAKLNLVRCGY